MKTRLSMASRAPAACLALSFLFIGCGPTVRTAVRYDARPYDAAELKQTKEGLTVELASIEKELPPELFTQAPACNTQGGIYIDPQTRQQEMEAFPLVHWSRGQDINRVAITNSTDHVLRLNQAVVRLADPAGNSYEPLSKDDLIALAGTARPCVAGVGTAQIRVLRVYDRNIEIMPQSTWKGYVVFAVPPGAGQQAGTWKYSFYELPVLVDDTGKPTKTTRFEVRYIVKKFADTYQRDGAFSAEKLISSKEVD
jgi:hypothetical protein